MTDFEATVEALGLSLPDYSAKPWSGTTFGTMKPHHRVGSLLLMSGHVPETLDGTVLHPGRVGDAVTLDEGYEAARLAGINALGAIRFALGTLNEVKSIAQSLNYVACIPEFDQVHKVSSGATDLFRDVFGEDAGLGCRATAGVSSLARNFCFEIILTVEVVE